MSKLCRDCKFYIPIDVVLGVCKITKQTGTVQELECKDNFQKVKKCKFCENYTPDSEKENIGMCMNKTLAYPEMVSTTCQWFKWKE